MFVPFPTTETEQSGGHMSMALFSQKKEGSMLSESFPTT